jgi:hypothetical protein
MKEPSDVTCCVVDHGLFVPLALKLAEGFKRVLYHSPWEDGFPILDKCIIGDGFSSIDRCDDIWKAKDDIDLFVFPDILHSGLQLELESQGYPVWGSREADSIETSREEFISILKGLRMEVVPHHACEGVTALRDYLSDRDDCYVKISKYRGSMETWHWRSWALDEMRIDDLAVKFGPAKEIVPFLVFDSIHTDIELGADTYCIDGQWPGLIQQGYEAKDEGLMAALRPREELPYQIQEVLDKFGPILGKHRYRNLFSMEIRVKGKQSFFIDPCCRGPLPAIGSQMELYANLPEIYWYGANGELIEPEPAAMFSAECLLTVKDPKGRWSQTEVPKSLRQWMKLGNSCEVDGRVCFPPDSDNDIGWLVAIGDTPSEVVDTMKDHAAMLPDGVSAKVDSLVDLIKEIEHAQEKGIDFTDEKMPEPAAVVE